MEQQLVQWAEQQGWRSDPSGWYGGYNGHLFNSGDFSVFSTIFPRLDDTTKDLLERYLQGNKENLGLVEFRISPRQLVVSMTPGTESVPTVEALLDKLTMELSALRIQGHGYCGNCGRLGDYPPAFLNEQALYMCDECYQNATGELLAANKEYGGSTNYGRGMFGALFAGLVGLIPWVIIDRLGYIAAIAGYLIGRLALWGYGKAGGRIGPMTRWIILGVTVLCVFVANLISLGFLLHDLEAYISLDNYIILFTHPEVAGSVWKDVLIGLGLALLGIWGILTGLKGQVERTQPTLRRPAAA